MTVLCTIDEKKYNVKIDESCVTFENDVELNFQEMIESLMC